MNKKEICEILEIDNGTLKNWEKNRPKLHTIVMKHFEEENHTDLNDIEYLKKEICKAIDKLPETKTKKFYHLMMAELADMGH